MKALVLTERNVFEYKDVPTPKIENDEVLINIKACGICGSDVHGIDGSSGRRKPPIIMGHEASGIISEIGSEVQNYKVGDKVTFDSTLYCGKCYYCGIGFHNLCDNRKVLGVSCADYHMDGAMAEYLAVPERILYKIPEGLSFENAAMVEPISVAFHAVNQTPIKLNDSVVVVGAGIIGLLIIQSLKLVGCGKIIAIDLSDKKLDLASELGATHTLKPDMHTISEVLKLTENRGADCAFEAVGLSATLESAINSVRKGGVVTLVGNVSSTTSFPLQSVVTNEKTVLSSCASNGEYKACLELLQSGAVNVESLISAKADLQDGGEWFHKLYKAKENLLKVILRP